MLKVKPIAFVDKAKERMRLYAENKLHDYPDLQKCIFKTADQNSALFLSELEKMKNKDPNISIDIKLNDAINGIILMWKMQGLDTNKIDNQVLIDTTNVFKELCKTIIKYTDVIKS